MTAQLFPHIKKEKFMTGQRGGQPNSYSLNNTVMLVAIAIAAVGLLYGISSWNASDQGKSNTQDTSPTNVPAPSKTP
jgi:hypothetical protein